jgi:meso-butanediol dehydrogenase/(S,S)-butanediol dehydrogenase/diacetyl reductase
MRLLILRPAPIEELELTDWEDGVFCHLTAPFLFCKAVVPVMVRQGGGNIINVSSGNVLFGSPVISAYGPAKAGMINFTQSLAVAYGPDGIRANTLTPARMLTEKKLEMLKNNPAERRRQNMVYPAGGPSTPEQVAQAMLFLTSDESAALTGHNLVADRGAAAYNPITVPGRLEADIRARLKSQGTQWLREET